MLTGEMLKQGQRKQTNLKHRGEYITTPTATFTVKP